MLQSFFNILLPIISISKVELAVVSLGHNGLKEKLLVAEENLVMSGVSHREPRETKSRG